MNDIGPFWLFKKVGEPELFESFDSFLTECILDTEPAFDRELFSQLHNEGKTFFLLDGFDEVSPHYKAFLLKFRAISCGSRRGLTWRMIWKPCLVSCHFAFSLCRMKHAMHMNESENILRLHQEMSLEQFFGKNKMKYDEDFLGSETISRVGFIRHDELQEFSLFKHKTFAEFLIAFFVIRDLKKIGERIVEDTLELLVEILMKEDCQVVRIFLDQALPHFTLDVNDTFYKTWAPIFNNVSMKTKFNVLSAVQPEALEALIQFILAMIKHTDNGLLILQKEDGKGNKASQNAVLYNNETTLNLLVSIVEKFPSGQSKFFHQKGFNRRNIFHLVVSHKNEGMFGIMLKLMEMMLTKDEINAMLLENDSEAFSIISELKEILSTEELKQRLFDSSKKSDGCFYLAVISSTEGVLQNLFRFFDGLSSEEKKGYIHQLCKEKQEKLFSSSGPKPQQRHFFDIT